MPHSDNSKRDDVEQSVIEYKKSLNQALKIQTELEKKLSQEKKAKKRLISKTDSLQSEITKLKANIDVVNNSLAAARQKIITLESAAKAHAQQEQEKNDAYIKLQNLLNNQEEENALLAGAYDQLTSQLEEQINRNKQLENQLNQPLTLTSALYDDSHFSADSEIFNEKLAVEPKKPAENVKSVEAPGDLQPASAASNSYNFFRYFSGSSEAKSAPTIENPVTKTLSEITKARVEQALAEKALAEKNSSRF